MRSTSGPNQVRPGAAGGVQRGRGLEGVGPAEMAQPENSFSATSGWSMSLCAWSSYLELPIEIVLLD